MKSRRPSLVQIAIATLLAEKFQPQHPPEPEPEPTAKPIEPPHVMSCAKWERMQKERQQ